MGTILVAVPAEVTEVPDFYDGRQWRLVTMLVYYRLPSGSNLLVQRRLDPLDGDNNLCEMLEVARAAQSWLYTHLVYRRMDGLAKVTAEESSSLERPYRCKVTIVKGGRAISRWFFEKEYGQWVPEE